MEWHDSYSIGVEKIDQQHQELFSMVTGLQASITSGTLNQELGKSLKFLVDYTRRHFADEEEFMQKIAYADYDNHTKLHGRLITEITNILLGLKKGKTVNGFELIDFLTDWLLTHIRQEDKRIGKAWAKIHQDKAEPSD